MRIAFYAPFKPLGHPRPSGDLAIGTGLYHYLEGQGHKLQMMSTFRSRWIYWKPWRWPQAAKAMRQSLQRGRQMEANLWLTYHTYYKAPDLLGPDCCRRLHLPYVIFQGIYSTKRSRDWRTWAGFVLNRRALLAADHVFTNRKEDLINLRRLIPDQRLTYVVPGIRAEHFQFDPAARQELRKEWGVGDGLVVLSAAMFRPGVKSEGLSWVIRSCGELLRQQHHLYLVIAGGGTEEPRLRKLAEQQLAGRARFVGQVARDKMYRFYSAGDLFVFPGIRESLGMVYLEAQACGLPVVAFANGGVPEVVADGRSGYLVQPFNTKEFLADIAGLLRDAVLREQTREAAAHYVRERHDLERNYHRIGEVLLELSERKEKGAWRSA